MQRRHAIACGLAGLTGGTALLSACGTAAPGEHGAAAGTPGCAGTTVPVWPDWQAFRQALLRPEGRIADPRDGRHDTVSEAQAYALFFALVGNDRPAFDALLDWTERELSQGDLGAQLPAWHWGRDERDRWRVLDGNAASDADLWIAYVLTQAARLWHRPDWLGKARRLARLILQRETAELPGMGLQLLPGPVGFLDHQGNARLNPSYLPLPVLRWWAVHGGDPAWGRLLDGSLQLLRQAAPHGLMPDWTWHAGKTLPSSSSSSSSSALRLSEDERRGGYNAIRSYLWLGLTDVGDPARTALLRQHASVCDVIERLGDAPLSLDPALPAARQPLTSGPRGFAAALLPLSLALGRQGAATLLRQRLEREPYNPQHYYDSALTLFALAHAQGRYHFDATGQLVLPWADCRTAAPDPIPATRKAP